MSRKHFKAIAFGLMEARPDPNMSTTDGLYRTWAFTAECIADQLAQFNAQFNRRTFLQAAGYYDENGARN